MKKIFLETEKREGVKGSPEEKMELKAALMLFLVVLGLSFISINFRGSATTSNSNVGSYHERLDVSDFDPRKRLESSGKSTTALPDKKVDDDASKSTASVTTTSSPDESEKFRKLIPGSRNKGGVDGKRIEPPKNSSTTSPSRRIPSPEQTSKKNSGKQKEEADEMKQSGEKQIPNATNDENSSISSTDSDTSGASVITTPKGTGERLSTSLSNNNPSTCQLKELDKTYAYNKDAHRWDATSFARSWCSEFPIPISSSDLKNSLRGKKVILLGDSVARNSFVLTMSRICNFKNYDKCMTRMPTFEFDIQNPKDNRGPMGCIPPEDQKTVDSSRCYLEGSFRSVYLKGLTTKKVPQDRAGRRQFIKSGLIGPVMEMNFANITLAYLPVTRPFQLQKAGIWMQQRQPINYLMGDVFIISIGPHLKMLEVAATPQTLVNGIKAIRAATDVPILVAEFVHALHQPKEYNEFINKLMKILQRNFTSILNVEMVPQRFVTKNGFPLVSGSMKASDEENKKDTTGLKQCGYYDAQHPALRCQIVTSEMLLAGIVSRMKWYDRAKKQPGR